MQPSYAMGAGLLEPASRRHRYPLRDFCVAVGHFFGHPYFAIRRLRPSLRSPFMLMWVSCWAAGVCLWGARRDVIGIPVYLWLIPISLVFSLLYLAFDCFWHLHHQDEPWSPWLVPGIAAIGAFILVLMALR